MRKAAYILLVLLAVALTPRVATAMHISEGILPISWAALWFAIAIPFVALGLRTVQRRQKRDPKYMALVSLVGAAIFVISCMPVPIGYTCSHPTGTGLGALLIGPGPTVVVSTIALLLQALLLSHGGLSTLGANIVSMGVVGAFVATGVYRGLRGIGVPMLVAAFAAGLLSDWATYATTSLELASAFTSTGQPLLGQFAALCIAFAPTQVPLGIVEGFLAAGAYRFVLNRRPELLSVGRATAVEDKI